MEDLLQLILIAVAALVVLAIALWIAKRFVWVEFAFTFGFSLALVIYSFMNGETKGDGVDNAFIQAILLFGYAIFTCADICFDKESYWETKIDKGFLSDDYYATTKLQEKSTFWTMLGSSALIGGLISGLIHFFAEDHQGAANRIIGWIGVVCLVYSIICIGMFIWGYFSAKRRYYDE